MCKNVEEKDSCQLQGSAYLGEGREKNGFGEAEKWSWCGQLFTLSKISVCYIALCIFRDIGSI